MMGTLFFNVKLIPWLDATTFLLPDDDTKKAGMDGYSFMEKRKLTSILFLMISEKKYDKIGL